MHLWNIRIKAGCEDSVPPVLPAAGYAHTGLWSGRRQPGQAKEFWIGQPERLASAYGGSVCV